MKKKGLILIYLGSCLFFVIMALINTYVRGRHDVPFNIVASYQGLVWFFVNVAAHICPGNFLLAAILVLYLKKFKVCGYLLAAAGLIYLICQYLVPGVDVLLRNIPEQNVFKCILAVPLSGFDLDLLLGINFLPAVVAFERHKERRKIIGLLNLFLGWIPPLWVVLLVWAFRNDKKAKADETVREKKGPAKAKSVHQRIAKKKGRKKK